MNYFRTRKVHTEALLGADEVYTSEWRQVSQYDRITGLVFSHEDGSLSIEQSIDGVNTDFVHTAIAVAGDTGEELDFKIYGEWFRVVYTNGTDAQTIFRLAVYATPQG